MKEWILVIQIVISPFSPRVETTVVFPPFESEAACEFYSKTYRVKWKTKPFLELRKCSSDGTKFIDPLDPNVLIIRR